MKYRYTYNGNPEYVTLSVNGMKLTERRYGVSDLYMEGCSEEEQLLHSLLASSNGVLEARYNAYEVTARRAAAHSRDEVLGGLLEILKQWAVTHGIDEEWEQLPTYRQDVAMKRHSGAEERETVDY